MVQKILHCSECNSKNLSKQRELHDKSVIYRCRDCGNQKKIKRRSPGYTDKRVDRESF